MKVESTPSVSLRSCFDALTGYCRRLSVEARQSSEGRTLVLQTPRDKTIVSLAGTHRVQRIPRGETRRHTSTATIVVLEDRGAVAYELDPSDVREKFTRGSGPGGQHRNTSDTCVVLTHVPTGTTVRMDERSQWDSRRKAWAEMERRLAEAAVSGRQSELNAERNQQVSSPERSAKSFTHNDQRDEVVDHETGRKWRLSRFMKGRI